MTPREVCLPGFPGFYESRLSAIVDSEIERLAEWMDENQSDPDYHPDDYQPEALRVSHGDFLWEYVDHSNASLSIAQDYLRAFNHISSKLLKCDLDISWSNLISPKKYNFESDRAFAHIPEKTITKLFTISEKSGHGVLARVIEDRHTSRSGFCSWYSNCLLEWLAKPLKEWDHNELTTLLIAALEAHGETDGFYEECCEYCEEASSSNGNYIDGALDSSALHRRVDEERAKLLAEAEKDEPSYLETHYRCPETHDMFT